MSEDTSPKLAEIRELEREARRLERVRLLTAVPDADTARPLPSARDDGPDPKEAA
jgi:hypothetical protein